MKIHEFQLNVIVVQLTMDELRDIIHGLKYTSSTDVAYDRIKKIKEELASHYSTQVFSIDNG